MQIYFYSGKSTKSVYILCIYTVRVHKMQKIAVILWVSYGYPMGILWCDHVHHRITPLSV